MTSDLLILGAGPAGLGAAFRAASSGRSVTVLEASDRVGGASASHEVGGLRVDLGSHRLHPSIEPRILADLRSLLGDDLQKRPRHGRIRLAGRWISFPLQAKELFTTMPRGFVIKAGLEALGAPFRRPSQDTFAEVLRAGLGRTMCEAFYFPYARKLWGSEPDELSGEQARRRVTADSPLKVLGRVLRGSGSGGARGAGTFWYPRRGYGQISEALARGAHDKGAVIELGAMVERVTTSKDRVEVAVPDGRTFTGGTVWSTLPVTLLARMLEPEPPRHLMQGLDDLPFRSMLLVYLVLRGDRYTEFDAHYFPESFTRVTRISEPKNYRASDEDPRDLTVLCAEIPCSTGEDLWTLCDEDAGALVIEALRASDLPEPDVAEAVVERLRFAYPIYKAGFEERFEALDRWLGENERILTFGRLGLFAHDNLHHALAMAYAAADAVLPDGTFDTDRWASARERFKRHVVED